MGAPVGTESWDFPALVSAAEAALRLSTEAHSAWGFGRHESWDLDQSEGIIRFSDPEVNIAEAPAQIVGSFDSNSGTWLWAWANRSIEPRLTEHSLKVKAFGERRGFQRLVEPKWKAGERDCWSMAAISALLNGAQGVYRGDTGAGGVFLTFGAVKIRKYSEDGG
jgi:hypothetical protein